MEINIFSIIGAIWIICIISLVIYIRKKTKSIRDNQSNKAKAYINATVIIISIIELLVAYLTTEKHISKSIAILLFCLLPICISILSYLAYYKSKAIKSNNH